MLAPLPGMRALAFENDATGNVYHVVDGDTIDVASFGRIRLADIDTPEVGQAGYQEAKDYTTSLVLNKQVYLDVDDLYGKDRYGRWVCVVYVRHNGTHLLNVNEALLEQGVAALDDFPNQFNPQDWTLYVYSPLTATPGTTSPGPPSTSAPPSPPFLLGVGLGAGAVALAVVVLITWSGSRRGRRR